MKIIQLKAENIKRLKAIDLVIDPATNVVVIAGKNGQGKTSLLDSLWYALGGKDVLPTQPIRTGEDHASVTLDLGEYVITRTFTDKESYLKVENKQGAKFSSPQAMLDKLVGSLTFDPLAFAKKSTKEQREILLNLTGIDLAPLEAERKAAYEERTMVNRELKQLEAQLAGLKIEPGLAPTAEVNVTEVAQQLSDAKSAATMFLGNKTVIERLNARLGELKIEQEKIEAEKIRLESLQAAHVQQDIPALEKQLAEAETVNTRFRSIKAYKVALDTTEAKRAEYKKLDEAVSQADIKKLNILDQAKMPIEGISVTDEGVIFNKIPFEQISAAEQLKVSLAIAMAMNPTIRVIRIMDGSLLDSSNMKVIEEMAAANDYQVWIERVDESGKVGVIIEDGEVKASAA